MSDSESISFDDDDESEPVESSDLSDSGFSDEEEKKPASKKKIVTKNAPPPKSSTKKTAPVKSTTTKSTAKKKIEPAEDQKVKINRTPPAPKPSRPAVPVAHPQVISANPSTHLVPPRRVGLSKRDKPPPLHHQ